MAHNLLAEMARKKIKKRDLANVLKTSEITVSRKIQGLSNFTVPEAIKIRDTFFPAETLEYLFEEDSTREEG